MAGEKVGKTLETLTDRAAGSLGGWIDSKPVAGISWLKWIFNFIIN